MSDVTQDQVLNHEDVRLNDVITVVSPDGDWAKRGRVTGIARLPRGGSVFDLHGHVEGVGIGMDEGDFIITEIRDGAPCPVCETPDERVVGPQCFRCGMVRPVPYGVMP